MKVIENGELPITVQKEGDCLRLWQEVDDMFFIDKKGAKQLIEILKEFVDENQ